MAKKKSELEKKWEKELEEVKNTNQTGGFFGIVILAIIIVLLFGGNSSSSDDEDTTPKKYTACENRSDTYHKCSWSAWEDRCVCKQR